MTNPTFDNLMAKLRESRRDLKLVSENLDASFHDGAGRGGTEMAFKIAEQDVMQLRATVDAITKQLLYRTWSTEFKFKIDESMKPGNWLFPK